MENIKRIYQLLLQNNGLRIREISNQLDLDKSFVADVLFSIDAHKYWYQNESSLWFAQEGTLYFSTDKEDGYDEDEYDEDEYDEVEYDEDEYDDLQIDIVLPKNIELERYVVGEASDVLRIYLSEILKYRQLTHEESKELIKRYRRGDLKAYDILVKSNLKLVVNIARLYKGKGVTYEDLIQEGSIGLLKAIDKADLTYHSFTEYLKSYIFQSISVAVSALPYMIKIPLNQVSAHRKVCKFINQYELLNGCEPSLSEIENLIELSAIELETVCNLPKNLEDITYSFDDWESIESEAKHIYDIHEYEYIKEYINILLKSLNKREAEILRKHYGIDAKQELSLERIGNELSLTRERVRQIEGKAIKKLRERLSVKRSTELDDNAKENKHVPNIIGRVNKHIEKETNVTKKVHVIPNDSNLKNNSSINIELQLCLMKSIKLNGSKSPHKAIYVLTLIKGICEGFINPERIYLDDKLIYTFNLLWDKYVPKDSPYTKGIANPYIHLSSDKFYFLHLIQPNHIKNNSWTVNSIRKICDYAYVCNDFCEYIKYEENRKRVLEILIKKYKLNCIHNDNIELRNNTKEHTETNAIDSSTLEDIILHTKIPTLPKPKIPNRYGAALFRLTYPNGIVEESDDYLTTYVNFIKYASPDRVRDLNIYSLGVNLIVQKDGILPKYKKMFKDVGNGYFFNAISTTHKKYEIMSFISEQLKLDVKVELIAKANI